MKQFTQLGVLAAFSLPVLVSTTLADDGFNVYTYVCEGVIQSLGMGTDGINAYLYSESGPKDIDAAIQYINEDYPVWGYYDKGLKQKSAAFSKSFSEELADEEVKEWAQSTFFDFRVLCANLEASNYMGNEALKKAFLRYKNRVTPFMKQFDQYRFGGAKLDPKGAEYVVLLVDTEYSIDRIRETIEKCLAEELDIDATIREIRRYGVYQREMTAKMGTIKGADAERFQAIFRAINSQASITSAMTELKAKIDELKALDYYEHNELKELCENL